jgi:hypothetical protein
MHGTTNIKLTITVLFALFFPHTRFLHAIKPSNKLINHEKLLERIKKDMNAEQKEVIAFEHDSNIALSKSTHHVLIYMQFSQCRVI